MLYSVARRNLLLLAAVGSAMSCTTARAQYTWAFPGTSSTWNLNTNWSPLGIPNAPSATVVVGSGAAYTVSIDGSVAVNSVSIAIPATVSLAAGQEIYLIGPGAGLSNAGTFIVNASGAATATNFRLQNGDFTLNGAGQLVLNANAATLDSAAVTWWSGGERLINGPGHTIRGTGRIRTYLTNNGIVNASASGATLWLTDRDMINNATMKATGGGILAVSVRVDQTASATMLAENGSRIDVASAVSNGTIGSTGSGEFRFAGTASIGSNTLIGRVNIPGNVVVYVENADLLNNSTLTVNSSGAAQQTLFELRNGPSTFSGSGVVRLNADPSTLDSAQIAYWAGSELLTNAAGHSIRGTGRIRPYLTNNSTIAADVSGRTLWLSDHPKTNNSILEATGGGTLHVAANIVQSPTALIRSDGSSSVVIQGCNINGGTISAAPGSAVNMIGSASLSSNPLISGRLEILANNSMYFEATGMVNNGTFTINPTGANNATSAILRNGPGTFAGNGTVVLNADPSNLDSAQLVWWAGNETLTNSASHRIRGTGHIRTHLVNEGTISADVNGATLWISDLSGINNNLMRATDGGNLTITIPYTQSDAGRILAETGSSVTLSGMSISGGQLQSHGTGVINTQGSMSLGTLTNAATMRVVPGNTTYLIGGSTLTNNSTLSVGSKITSGNAYLVTYNGPVSLMGTGSLVLDSFEDNADAAQLTWWNGSEVVTNGPSHTIRGVGRIAVYLTNDGLVSADMPATTLWLSHRTKTNNNIIRAINGANIALTTGLVQGDSGRVQAFDGSVVTISGASLNGGTLESAGSGSFAVQNSSYLQTFTNNSRINMLSGNTTYTGGSNIVTNNGVITLGAPSTNSNAYYVPQGGPVTLAGNGNFILDASLTNLDLATIAWWSGSEVLTNASGHTIGGSGRIRTYLQNDGIISPGALGGGIGEIAKTEMLLTFGSTSRLNIEVASPTSYDKIIGNAPLTLGGRLQVRLINGYTGGIGATYEIVHGGSITGTFSLIDIPEHPTIGLKYGVQYTDNSVLLRVTCDVDFNSDGVIDLFDYLDFVDTFAMGVPDSDFNADGVVDFFDYLDFVDQFARGCE